MSPSTTNLDRAEAVDAVAWYIAQRDQTSRADRPDPDINAAEIVQALMLRGWRRTAARIAPAWTPDPNATPADLNTVRQRAAQARAGLVRRPTATLTAAQVRALYDGALTEINVAGHTLTHADVTDTWIGMAIGPGDTTDDGTPAEHMWAEIATALRHEYEPKETDQ